MILIMADDMGYSDIGCYGSEISTPNLDRLAKNGVRFRNFYNETKCCPSRASLLTGIYHHEAGVGGMISESDKEITEGPYQGFLNEKSITIAEILKNVGYSTYMAGKWHLGERKEHWPVKRGFDKHFGLISGASSYFELILNQERKRVMANNDQSWFPPESDFYMTDAFTDSAVSMISEHVKQQSEKPFFLYLAYNAPHWPLHALPEDIEKYEGKYDIGWDSIRQQRFDKMIREGIWDESIKLSPRPESVEAWKKQENKKQWARLMQIYAAMVDRMDQGIGRVLYELEKNQLSENTLIIFLSDNGACSVSVEERGLHIDGSVVGQKGSYKAYKEPWANVSNTPFRFYKNWIHEGGISTPFIMYWPKYIKRKRIIKNDYGHILDVMPTILELTETKYPQTYKGKKLVSLKGRSLMPLVHNKTVEERKEPLFWEFNGAAAVRLGDYKLVSYRDKKWELYHLKSDPTELFDLSSEQPELTNEMKKLYQEWACRVGVKKK
ncbi:arylsulfatase [Marinifilum sp. JC070]|uniref:Arylsulfatase n=1 Tax=Marinifilum caeruleilacunae TaxID=2499076 RepID=A0ABX1WYS3_9BACT|nr:arylsulfatase [Marinifilum caeruleilacunae]